MAKKPKYWYCQLPAGNAREFPRLDEELRKRRVKAEICRLIQGGRIYRIPVSQLSRLPKDEKGPYLGDAESGHTIWAFKDDHDYEDFREGRPWLPIPPPRKTREI